MRTRISGCKKALRARNRKKPTDRVRMVGKAKNIFVGHFKYSFFVPRVPLRKLLIAVCAALQNLVSWRNLFVAAGSAISNQMRVLCVCFVQHHDHNEHGSNSQDTRIQRIQSRSSQRALSTKR
jgi:hypothetical protein